MKTFPSVGPLRLVLLVLATCAIALAPFSGGEVQYTFPEVITTLVAPPFAVMMVFILGLDMLMSWVFMAGREVADKRRLRAVIMLEIVALAALIAVWAPFFSDLGR